MLRITDCPTSISRREAEALQRWAYGRRVIEAGSLLGGSTIIIAEVAAHVTSIDKHQDYTTPTARRFHSNLLRAGLAGKVDSIIGDCRVELPRSTGDFTFLDLTGDYLLTKQALLASTTPLVAVHDMGRVRCGGVEQAIRELGYEILEHVDTLVVCRKGT